MTDLLNTALNLLTVVLLIYWAYWFRMNARAALAAQKASALETAETRMLAGEVRTLLTDVRGQVSRVTAMKSTVGESIRGVAEMIQTDQTMTVRVGDLLDKVGTLLVKVEVIAHRIEAGAVSLQDTAAEIKQVQTDNPPSGVIRTGDAWTPSSQERRQTPFNNTPGGDTAEIG